LRDRDDIGAEEDHARSMSLSQRSSNVRRRRRAMEAQDDELPDLLVEW
jgi:hypothetical protein